MNRMGGNWGFVEFARCCLVWLVGLKGGLWRLDSFSLRCTVLYSTNEYAKGGKMGQNGGWTGRFLVKRWRVIYCYFTVINPALRGDKADMSSIPKYHKYQEPVLRQHHMVRSTAKERRKTATVDGENRAEIHSQCSNQRTFYMWNTSI